MGGEISIILADQVPASICCVLQTRIRQGTLLMGNVRDRQYSPGVSSSITNSAHQVVDPETRREAQDFKGPLAFHMMRLSLKLGAHYRTSFCRLVVVFDC